jgi:predicted GIY-YIG superfamily endonuclease
MEQRQGCKWFPEEEQRLRDAYLDGTPIASLAEQHLRSRQSIRTRLIRLGLLEPKKNSTPDRIETPSVIRAWTYLLISERGEVYLGATTNLRQRLRRHNSVDSTLWTRGRKWHLLAVRGFATRKEAFGYEHELKKGPHKKKKWAQQRAERAFKIASRHNYIFSPQHGPTK